MKRKKLSLSQKVFYALSFLIVISMVLSSIVMVLDPTF
jgi:cell division protein FtsL